VRRAMIIMVSASGTPVSAIARLVAADERGEPAQVVHALRDLQREPHQIAVGAPVAKSSGERTSYSSVEWNDSMTRVVLRRAGPTHRMVDRKRAAGNAEQVADDHADHAVGAHVGRHRPARSLPLVMLGQGNAYDPREPISRHRRQAQLAAACLLDCGR
jgi:hypothetical protein